MKAKMENVRYAERTLESHALHPHVREVLTTLFRGCETDDIRQSISKFVAETAIPEKAETNAAYLTHCANVLPELVEALRLARHYLANCTPHIKPTESHPLPLPVIVKALERAETITIP